MKILITGVDGYLGSSIHKTLKLKGYEVWGLSRKRQDENILKTDLSNFFEVKKVASTFDHLHFFIHCAVENTKIANVKTYKDSNNILFIKNILNAFSNKIGHFIFFSSIAVYGEDKRFDYINIDDQLRPSSNYGKDKIIIEKIIISSTIKNYSILRLTPVFDKQNLKDIKKRVYLPYLNFIKIRIKPSPKYSLANLTTVLKKVIEIIKEKKTINKIENIADKRFYFQNDLIKLFDGITITFPIFLIRPLYLISYLFPKKLAYSIRCNIHKLFYSNLYKV